MDLQKSIYDPIGPSSFPQTEVQKPPENQAAQVNAPSELPVLLLDEAGLISDCNKTLEMLFGYRLCEIAWQHISCLIPQLAGLELVKKGRINPRLDFICHCGHIFQGLSKEGSAILAEMNLIGVQHNGSFALRVILHPPV